MTYPEQFTSESRARVEAERIRAGRAFQKLRDDEPTAEWSTRKGAWDQQAFYEQILRVFAVFGHEACGLAQMGVWTVDRVRSETNEFLRRFVIHEYYENGRDRDGRKFPEMTSNLNGGLLIPIQQLFRQSPQWRQFEDELLGVAEELGGCATLQKASLGSSVLADSTPDQLYSKTATDTDSEESNQNPETETWAEMLESRVAGPEQKGPVAIPPRGSPVVGSGQRGGNLSRAVAELPKLPDLASRKLLVEWEDLTDRQGFDGGHLQWHKAESDRLVRVRAQAAPDSRARGPVTDDCESVGISQTASLANARLLQYIDEYWRLWVQDRVPNSRAFADWLGELRLLVIQEVAGLWLGGNRWHQQWFERSCRAQLDVELSPAIQTWKAHARRIEIERLQSEPFIVPISSTVENVSNPNLVATGSDGSDPTIPLGETSTDTNRGLKHVDLLVAIVDRKKITIETWAADHKFGRSTVFSWKALLSKGEPLGGKLSSEKSEEIEQAIEADAKELGLPTRTDSD